MKHYTLEGRELRSGHDTAPCIFCGLSINHFNDEGVGWCVGSVVGGKPLRFLYCHQPACEAAKLHDHEIWRCGCETDYLENVGPVCTGCNRLREDALPWAFECPSLEEITVLGVANLRALILQDVYKLLPKETIQTWGSDPYSSLTGFLSPDGSFRRNSWQESDHNPSHIRDLPLESLMSLRRILQHPRYGL